MIASHLPLVTQASRHSVHVTAVPNRHAKNECYAKMV
jgi:hypothetical protein